MPKHTTEKTLKLIAVVGKYGKVARYFNNQDLIPDYFFVAERTVGNETQRFVGHHCGTFDPDEYDTIINV